MVQSNNRQKLIIQTIEKEYQEFLAQLAILKKKRDAIIADYQKKIDEIKLAEIRQQYGADNT